MIKVPKDMIIEKIKEKTSLTDKDIEIKVKDKLDQLSGLISEEGALHIIANELGVKILEDAGKLQVKNVLAGMRNVQLTGKVVKIYEVREFDKNNRKGKVGNFLIGDSTGVMRVVAWNDKANILNKIKPQDTVKIENGYSRDNQGRTEIHLGDKSVVSINPSGAEDIKVKPLTNERKSIKDLNENENNVDIMGTIVQIFDTKFWNIDPETNKRVQEKNGQFYLEDKLVNNPDFSYVTNLFLDDGTENIRVVLWKNQTQKLFNKSHEEIVKMKDTGFEDIKTEMLGQIVKFTGRTNKNEMFDRLEFVARFVDATPDADEEIKRLKEAEKEEPKVEAKKPEQVVEKAEETPIEPVVEENKEEETIAEPVVETPVVEPAVEKVEVPTETIPEPVQEEVVEPAVDKPVEFSVSTPEDEVSPQETLETEAKPSSEKKPEESLTKEPEEDLEELEVIDEPEEPAKEEIEAIDDIDDITDIDSI